MISFTLQGPRTARHYALAFLGLLVAVQLLAGLTGSVLGVFHLGSASVPVAAGPRADGGLIFNGGFETDLSGWHDSCGGCGDPRLSRDLGVHKFGLASMRLSTSTAGANANYWNIPVRPKTNYTLSVWALQRTGSPRTVALRVAESGTHATKQTYALPSGKWTRLATVFTTSPGALKLSDVDIVNVQPLHLTLWIDGVHLVRGGTSVAPPKPPVAVLPIANGGFETGLGGWFDSCGGCGEPQLSRDTTIHRFGTASLKVVAQTFEANANYDNVGVKPGATYAFSTWVFQKSGTTRDVTLRIGRQGDRPVLQTFGVPNAVWTHVVLSFVAPSSGDLTDADVMNGDSAPLTYWIDGISLTRTRL